MNFKQNGPTWRYALDPLDPQLYIFTGCNEVVAKVVFLLVSAILSTGYAGMPPPGADTPQEQTPRSRHPPEQTPPGADTPRGRHPPRADISLEQTLLEQTLAPSPPEQTPLGNRHPPEADTTP